MVDFQVISFLILVLSAGGAAAPSAPLVPVAMLTAVVLSVPEVTGVPRRSVWVNSRTGSMRVTAVPTRS